MKKIVLINGGTGGIGLATAKELGKVGYFVIMTGIDDEGGNNCIKELTSMGIEAEYMHCNVTVEDEVNACFAKITEKYGKLDALVNNAGGLCGRSRFEDMTTEFYRTVMGLNLDSVFFASRAAIPLLKKSAESGEHPSIINFASNAAWNAGGRGAGVYGTAKGAVVLMTRALAKDLAEYGIRVNAVSPGTIDTPFHDATRKNNPALFESFKNGILMKRLGQASEVGTVIEFLLSDKASFITGEIIQINGGQDLL